MAKFQNKYRIESNRLQSWDYSAPGQYFLTVCINHFQCILGYVENGEMILSPEGEIVKSEIEKIPTYHPRIILDEWVVMPNHIHLIVELTGYGNDVAERGGAAGCDEGAERGNVAGCDDVETIHELSLRHRTHRRKMLIPTILGKLKMITSKQINVLNGTAGHKNWQRDYYDHIIRDYRSYFNIKSYIRNNPKKWKKDRFNN